MQPPDWLMVTGGGGGGASGSGAGAGAEAAVTTGPELKTGAEPEVGGGAPLLSLLWLCATSSAQPPTIRTITKAMARPTPRHPENPLRSDRPASSPIFRLSLLISKNLALVTPAPERRRTASQPGTPRHRPLGKVRPRVRAPCQGYSPERAGVRVIGDVLGTKAQHGVGLAGVHAGAGALAAQGGAEEHGHLLAEQVCSDDRDAVGDVLGDHRAAVRRHDLGLALWLAQELQLLAGLAVRGRVHEAHVQRALEGLVRRPVQLVGGRPLVDLHPLGQVPGVHLLLQ